MKRILFIFFLLAASCAPIQPFDFSEMREVERNMTRLRQVVALSGGQDSMDSSKRDRADLGWAYYYAGQVALAEGDLEKAQNHFTRAEELIQQLTEEIIADYLTDTEETPEGVTL